MKSELKYSFDFSIQMPAPLPYRSSSDWSETANQITSDMCQAVDNFSNIRPLRACLKGSAFDVDVFFENE